MLDDTPYTEKDKHYEYLTPIQQQATILSKPRDTKLIKRLEDSAGTPLYYATLQPDSLLAHLRKLRLKLALKQLPMLTQYRRWYTRRNIQQSAVCEAMLGRAMLARAENQIQTNSMGLQCVVQFCYQQNAQSQT